MMYLKYKIKKTILIIIIAFVPLTIMFSMFVYWTKKVEPAIVARADSKARAMALNSSTDVLNEYFKEVNTQEFIDLIIENGKIISVKTDTIKLNKISTEISSKIQKELYNMGSQEVSFTIGSLNGNKILYNIGPKIKIKITPSGIVSAKFITSFEEAGINQTLHKIKLVVQTKVIVVAPFITKYQEYNHEIVIAETVLIGDIPSTYYNISGVEGLNKDDTLNMLE